MPSVYFITGVSSGFGHALALRAVAAGHTVVGTVRSRARSAEAVSTLEGKGIVVTELNVTNSSACTDVINNVAKRYGSIDVLINNAGYSILGAMESFRYGADFIKKSKADTRPATKKLSNKWRPTFTVRSD